MFKKIYQVPYGTKDILPGEMKARRQLEDAIINVFDKWGYDEVKTPAFEYVETFGDSAKGEFRFLDRNNKLLMLRSDMTAPIARLTATRLQAGEKIKRLCYLANLYRYEEIQAGRQCEFEQAGVELLGASGATADAEVVVLAAEALQACGVGTFTISIGHVDFINGLAEEAGFDAEQVAELKSCLRNHDAVGLANLAAGMAVAPELKEIFAKMLFLQGDKDLLLEMQGKLSNVKALAALANLLELHELLEAYGASEHVLYDLGLYRSLDYYTGMLFEVYMPEIGYPIAGGGRYDKMMQSFGLECPATGFALGLDRVALVLARAQKLKDTRAWDVLVAWSEDKLLEAIAKAQALRAEGRSVKLCTEAMSLEDAAKALKDYACNSLVYVN